jgi:hypothetical protein
MLNHNPLLTAAKDKYICKQFIKCYLRFFYVLLELIAVKFRFNISPPPPNALLYLKSGLFLSGYG